MEKSYTKKIKGGIICLIFTLLLFASCNFQNLSLSQTEASSSSQILTEQKKFDSYLSNLFQSEVTGSTINLHYTLTNPKEFGIKHYKVTYGDISEKSKKKSQAQLENTLSALNSFDYESLDTRQKLTYDIITNYLSTQSNNSKYTYYDEYLRPTTGTAAQLPFLLAEYTFYTKKDVTDYLTLLSQTKDYFTQIIDFEERKSQEGLFMADYAADTIIESCTKFTQNPDDNFLLKTFQNRIEQVPGLSEEDKASYLFQNDSLVKNNVIPAYEKLAAVISHLKGTGTNSGGLCGFENGASYYESLVHMNTGSDKDVPALQKMVEKQRNEDLSNLNILIVENPKLLQASSNPALTSGDDPDAILKLLQEKMKADFMPAVDSNYEINYVDPSLEASTAPAFYLTAPIDNTSHNVIYINQSSSYSGIQLFTTLAHEGYPGHLYQTTASLRTNMPYIRALLNYPGYVEGWATYVEMLSYQYTDLDPKLSSMLQLNQSSLLSLYATLDMGVHYDKWNLSDAKEFFASYGIKEETTIQKIYELVVEEPSHYLKYYIGYLEFLELKEYAKSVYGDSFSEKAFHQAVVTIGPAPFSILRKYLTDYYDPTLK